MKQIVLSTCLILLMGFTLSFGATLVVEEDYPVLGEGVNVYITGHSDPQQVTLTVVYRPNSATTLEKAVGSFQGNGSLVWKPIAPGITTLVAKGADGKKVTSKNVATRYPATPVSGVIVMVLAGILLFGGAGWSLRRALSDTTDN